MSSSDNENQHFSMHKEGPCLIWEQSPLTEGYRENLLISILILDSQPGIQALLSHSFVIEPSARGKTQCQYLCKLCLDKADTSKPTKLPESSNLLFIPVPLRMARDFLSFSITFPPTFCKMSETKSYLKLGTSLIFPFPFLEGYTNQKYTTYSHSNTVGHLFLKSLVR